MSSLTEFQFPLCSTPKLKTPPPASNIKIVLHHKPTQGRQHKYILLISVRYTSIILQCSRAEI